MRNLVLALLLFIPFVSYSQDLITLRNGEQIDCKITKVDSIIVYYDFFKGERKLSSYVAINDIHSYKINEIDNGQDKPIDGALIQDNTVVIDTAKYVKETNIWINLITFSQRYGLHANGWSVQYYGYNFRNTSKWTVPVIFGVERFEISTDYFSQFDYQSANMGYFLAGVAPFYRLNDNFYLNLGVNIVFGEEDLMDFHGNESSNTFFGVSPSQGIYFIPRSKVGLTLGISVYEKLLSSEVYKNDLGLKLELGIKF